MVFCSVVATTGNSQKETHRFQFKQFHTILNAYLCAYGLKFGWCWYFFHSRYSFEQRSGVKVTSALPHKIFNKLLASSYHFHSLCLLILMPYHLYFLCPYSLSVVFFCSITRSPTLSTSHATRYCNELEKCYFFTIYRSTEIRNHFASFRRPNLLIISMSKYPRSFPAFRYAIPLMCFS